MVTAYTGNSAYCFTHSLHMCLQCAGMRAVPEVGLLECMTGMPFGATFWRRQPPVFFPSPSAMDPDRGLTLALQTVGWTCEVLRFEETAEALEALREALRRGPALIGPLDPASLPYDPSQKLRRRGGDHFVVAIRLVDDLVQVHDPQLYPFATLPITDLAQAWNAKHIGYSAAAYTFRCDFRIQRDVSEAEMLSSTVGTALKMMTSVSTGPVVYGGPQAFERTANVLREDPPDVFTGSLTRFALPLGARRCVDAAGFFEVIGASEAARLMVSKGEAFGQAQYHAVQNDWKRTAEVFDRLSRIEPDCISGLFRLAE